MKTIDLDMMSSIKSYFKSVKYHVLKSFCTRLKLLHQKHISNTAVVAISLLQEGQYDHVLRELVLSNNNTILFIQLLFTFGEMTISSVYPLTVVEL